MNIKIYEGIGLLVVLLVVGYFQRAKIKKFAQERYERDGVKIPNITWSKSGESFTEDIVIKRSKIWAVGDWGRIYPVLNEDGSWNLVNTIFGGKKNFIKVLLVLGVLALFLIGYYEVFHSFELYRQTCVQINVNPLG